MFLAWIILNGLVVLVGLFVLGRYRSQAPKATRIGIVALYGFGLWTLLFLALVKNVGGFFGLESEWRVVVEGLLLLGFPACILLLVVAVVTDRR